MNTNMNPNPDPHDDEAEAEWREVDGERNRRRAATEADGRYNVSIVRAADPETDPETEASARVYQQRVFIATARPMSLMDKLIVGLVVAVLLIGLVLLLTTVFSIALVLVIAGTFVGLARYAWLRLTGRAGGTGI